MLDIFVIGIFRKDTASVPGEKSMQTCTYVEIKKTSSGDKNTNQQSVPQVSQLHISYKMSSLFLLSHVIYFESQVESVDSFPPGWRQGIPYKKKERIGNPLFMYSMNSILAPQSHYWSCGSPHLFCQYYICPLLYKTN